MKKGLLLFLFISFIHSIQAQELISRFFGKDEGYDAQVSWTIFRDSRGIIWSGADGFGAAYFDGQSFDYLNEEDGLPAKIIIGFGEDHDNNIWISVQGHGACVYNGSEIVQYKVSDSLGLSSDNVMCYLARKNGDFLLGLHSGGIVKFENGKFEQILPDHPTITVYQMVEDKQGVVWFGTAIDGIGYIKEGEINFIGKDEGLSQRICLDIKIDQNGDLYVADFKGLARIRNFKVDKFWNLTQGDPGTDMVQGIHITQNNEVIFSTPQGFYKLIDEKALRIREHALRNIMVTRIVEGPGNSFYASTNGSGIVQFFTGAHEQFDLPDPTTGIEEVKANEDGDLVVFTTNQMYQMVDGELILQGDGFENFFPNMSSVEVMGKDDYLLISNQVGIGRYKLVNGKWKFSVLINSNGPRYARNYEGTKWVIIAGSQLDFEDFGTNEEIKRIQPGGWELTLFGMEQYADTIWMSRYDKGGILEVTPHDTTLYGQEEGIPESATVFLNLDNNNRLWFLSIEGEFGYKNGNGKFITFPSVINSTAYSMGFDRNNDLWISYAKAFVYVDLENYKIVKTRIFNEQDGISAGNTPIVRPTILPDGRIVMFRSEGEIYVFDPNKIDYSEEEPVILIDHVTGKDRTPLEAGWMERKKSLFSNPTKIELPYQSNHLTIDLRTVYFSSPDSVRYSYKVEGLDKNWSSPQNSNRVVLTNIPSGDFTLKFKALGANGVESQIIEIPLKITTPWYKTVKFYILVALFLIIFIWLIIKWRTKKIQREKEKLEEVVELRTAEVVREKEKVEEKNKEIEDSINYAQRIQKAILPPDKLFKKALPQSFVIYLPKDIVAGDFYWMEEHKGKIFFAAADCTGHGVPGAMVSVICNNGLNRSVREFGLDDPGKILDQTRDIVIKEFEKSEDEVKDGMDIALCAIKDKTLYFSGAHNSAIIIRKDESAEEGIALIELKGDKQPIGKFEYAKPFETKELTLYSGDHIYVFSDGYPDQFGGEKGKKFKSANLKRLLKKINHLSIEDQKSEIVKAFKDWKGDFEQIDDVCIIGVKI